MDDYVNYHPKLSGHNYRCLRLKGEGGAVSATNVPDLGAVRDLPAIFNAMITPASSSPPRHPCADIDVG